MMTSEQADPFRLDGKVVLVTGGGQGIGLATARMCRRTGARVVLLDRDASLLSAANNDEVDSALWDSRVLDVTQESEVAAVIGKIAQEHGRIDVLVNNAGIAIRDEAVRLSRTAWDQVMAVNVTGMFLCAREVARCMIESKTAGAIVNTASIMGLSGGGVYPNISYQTSKGAVVNLTRALAVEWAPHGIRVNAVAPTYVDTPFIKALTAQPEVIARIKAMTPLGRLARAEEVAAAIVFLASPAASMVTGHTLAVDGGYLAQ
jgi:2-deoxy-D-gluconate 3-dehydrogenase